MDTTPIYVEGDFSLYVDDQTWNGNIYRLGTYRYESVGGGVKTVKKYIIVHVDTNALKRAQTELQ